MPKRFFKFFKVKPFLVLIIFVATVLRLIVLDKVPPSLNWDEVSHGYNAFSILKTGKDEWGQTLPVIFKAYGDYKLPVYIYLAAISESFFGLNAFAVRLPSVLAGIGTVIFTYFLVLELLSKIKNQSLIASGKLLATISALLVATEPWSLFLSRGAFEANLALFFIVAGVYFFLKGISQTTNYLLLASVFLGLSVWTYNSARIFVPLLIVTLFLVFKKEVLQVFRKNKKLSTYNSGQRPVVLWTILLTTFFFLPMFWQLLNPIGQARYGKLSILDEGAIGQIIEARQNSSYSPFVTRLIYNRPTYFIQRFVFNWVSHFTYYFLFISGGNHYQFSVPEYGLLHIVNLPFFFLGILLLLKKALKGNSVAIFLLSWLFLAPIPDSLTRDAPHVLRSITMLPAPMILSSLGLVSFVVWSEKFVGERIMERYSFKGFPRKKALYLAYILVIIILANNYLTKYFGEYKKNYSWSWQYGYKEAVDYTKDHYDDYDKVIITKKYGEPHEFFLFYWPWDPRKYKEDPNLNRFYQSNWYWIDRFDKFYFVNDWDIPKEEWQSFKLESGEEFNCEDIKCLLITSPTNFPKRWNKLETITFLDGNPAFEIYEN